MGDKFHLKLNINGRPIANKYREGKMKRTLKRELKDLKLLKGKRMDCQLVSSNVLMECSGLVAVTSMW